MEVQTTASSKRSPGLIVRMKNETAVPKLSEGVCKAMALAELKAISDLLRRAKNFGTQFQDGWYKQSRELHLFQERVFRLSEVQLQYSNQFRRHGLSDGRLLHAVKVTVECLNKQQRYMEKLKKKRSLGWRMSAFPSDLLSALEKVLELVDADPQSLTLGIAKTNLIRDLVEKCRVQRPAPLPFASDQTYVPISGSILEVQQALENVEGPRVVNLYGEPGLGKSSLAKYLALQYEEQKFKHMESSKCREIAFPDGVKYLLCGQGANEKIEQLQQDLLENLGFGVGSAPQPTDSMGAEYDNCFRHSYYRNLRCRLAEKKLLIVLDDLWEVEVMKKLYVDAKGVRYLVTSQIQDIWIAAEKIELKRPTKSEARQILANYTEGFPQNGEFRRNIQDVTDDIIGKLHRHPLSLANVGISIFGSQASDKSHWKMIEDDIQPYLDEISVFNTRPLLYNKPYSLTVGASMMLMVKGLRQDVLPLLDLIALFNGPCFPEDFVKFFYKRICRSNLRYAAQVKYLEGRSLVEFWEQHSEFMVSRNDLRTHYLREMRNLDMRTLAEHVLSGSHEHAGSLDNEDHDILTVIRAAMEFAEPFLNEVAANLEHRVRINNGGEIPKTMGSPSFLGIARTIRRHGEFRKLYKFLNHDKQDGWKQQAQQHTKKIILKFFCQGKLDDHSMAGLLQIPEATSIACCVLRRVWYRLQSSVAFSSAHGETLQTLVALSHNNSTESMQRASTIEALSEISALEDMDNIFGVADIWKALLLIDEQPALQIATIYFFEGLIGEAVSERLGVSEMWEILVTLLVYGNDIQVRLVAGRAVRRGLSSSFHVRTRIASIPNVFRQLSNVLESEATILEIRLLAGELLCKLSVDDKMASKENLEGVGKILANVIDANWSPDNEVDLRRGRIFYQATLGNYEEAMSSVSGILADNGLNILDLRNRAVLKRLCGDLQGAMDDFDAALQLISDSPGKQMNLPGIGDVGPCCFCKSIMLKHRGYLKYLMGDYVGAKEDGEVVIQSQLHAPVKIYPRVNYQMVEKLSFLCLGELGNLSFGELGSESSEQSLFGELGSEPTEQSLSVFYRRTNFFSILHSDLLRVISPGFRNLHS